MTPAAVVEVDQPGLAVAKQIVLLVDVRVDQAEALRSVAQLLLCPAHLLQNRADHTAGFTRPMVGEEPNQSFLGFGVRLDHALPVESVGDAQPNAVIVQSGRETPNLREVERHEAAVDESAVHPTKEGTGHPLRHAFYGYAHGAFTGRR